MGNSQAGASSSGQALTSCDGGIEQHLHTRFMDFADIILGVPNQGVLSSAKSKESARGASSKMYVSMSLDTHAISRGQFETHFSHPSARNLGTLLYSSFTNSSSGQAVADCMTERQFIEGAKKVCATPTDVAFFVKLFSNGRDDLSVLEVRAMIESCAVVACAESGQYGDGTGVLDSPRDRDVVQALVDALMSCNNRRGVTQSHVRSQVSGGAVTAGVTDRVTDRVTDNVPVSSCQSWITEHTPLMFHSLHSTLAELFLGRHHSELTDTKHKAPGAPAAPDSVPGGSSESGGGPPLSGVVQWSLYISLPAVYTRERQDFTSQEPKPPRPPTAFPEWELLYDSNAHGLSMNRFQHHSFDYKGHTVMLVSFGENDLVCVGCDTELRESPKPFGGMFCTALRLSPTFKEIESGDNMVYVNSKSRGLTEGVVVGRERRVSLHVNGDMTHVTGPDGRQGELHTIQVFGCEGGEVKAAQTRQKVWERGQVARAAKVGRGGETWEDSPDRLILDMGGVSTRHHQRPDTCETEQH